MIYHLIWSVESYYPRGRKEQSAISLRRTVITNLIHTPTYTKEQLDYYVGMTETSGNYSLSQTTRSADPGCNLIISIPSCGHSGKGRHLFAVDCRAGRRHHHHRRVLVKLCASITTALDFTQEPGTLALQFMASKWKFIAMATNESNTDPAVRKGDKLIWDALLMCSLFTDPQKDARPLAHPAHENGLLSVRHDKPA